MSEKSSKAGSAVRERETAERGSEPAREGRPSALRLASSRPQLVTLGRWLLHGDFKFTPVTLASHLRALRRIPRARDLRDIFGWNAPFSAQEFPRVAELLQAAGACSGAGDLVRSSVRFASFGRNLFAHSAFPGSAAKGVHFGPDTVRYLRALHVLPPPYGRLAELGTGCGAAGIWLAAHSREVWLTDTSRLALHYASQNMLINGVGPHVFAAHGDLLEGVHGPFDTVIADATRSGHGALPGGDWGIEAVVRMAEQALQRLAPRGRLFLWAAAPVVLGKDLLQQRLAALDANSIASLRYEEVDPDVGVPAGDGSVLDDVERFASVLLTVRVA